MVASRWEAFAGVFRETPAAAPAAIWQSVSVPTWKVDR